MSSHNQNSTSCVSRSKPDRRLKARIAIGAASSALVSASLAAHAQTACPTPDLLTGPARAFNEVFKADAASGLEKGEFETTAEFESRKAKISGPPQTLLKITPESREVKYNADQEQFSFYMGFLQGGVSYDLLRGLTSEQKSVVKGGLYEGVLDLLVQRTETMDTPYEVQNGYGAKFMIEKRNDTAWVVYEQPTRRGGRYDDLFAEHKSREARYLTLPMSRDVARGIAGQLGFVALVTPKSPYFVRGVLQLGPSVDFKKDITTDVSILIADIQCVGVRDPDGRLLASWVTR